MFKKCKSIQTERLVFVRVCEEGWAESDNNVYRVSFRGDENVVKLEVIIAQLWIY
jgi:hypothetical protein